jgi:type I site-specific restriction-modification system R (restriction) subunit
MFALNLPAFQHKIRNEGGKTWIFDNLRHKFVLLTPEEWVRQHFVNYLIIYKGFPPERIVNEAQLSLNGQKKRCDSVLYDKDINPLVIMEYKAPSININQKVFEQISAYNWSLRVRYLIVSNGLTHFCCKIDYENHKAVFIPEIPEYSKLQE